MTALQTLDQELSTDLTSDTEMKVDDSLVCLGLNSLDYVVPFYAWEETVNRPKNGISNS